MTIFESLSRVTEIEDKIMAERNSCGDCTEEEVSENFAGKIQRLEEQITHANDVKKRAQQIAEHLKSEAEHFNESTLKPLSSRIQKFHDVLSSFRYEISLETKTAKGGTKLNQRVNRKGNSTDWVHPLAELSDGQISVQGLATLFAASTEYRWSRWPSVLLDDPLQSSDLLHASAFIDILRGLIKDLKYQVFLSSHDLEEARYIIRKCERSGIDVSQCHLLGPGVNGVRAVFS
ncbi:MAG: hypothetical protein P1V20_09760 [Verrucomicrobiales bacterium]|nr:hypothetical protein [Verrucomicrobiales bacterium]